VEKFIGDAVMAVFGAPVAHEDDAERAVRSALRILKSLEDLNEERGLELAVRVGINTGEAVVALGARPEQGEGIVTGDVVNTAARIQTGAPVGGVAVGATTYASTKDVFDFDELEPIVGKGKSVPIAAWRATGSRTRFGSDLTRRHDTRLVGRDAERTLLATMLEKSIRDGSCQLVTISGEPGVGKSRMVYEPLEIVEGRPELITWRQGRCLPYGEGITFWALGEIVKADAGILESDSPEQASAKLDRALRAHAFDTDELDWFRARLAPLVGVEAVASAEREESFIAWRRFLEGIAGSDPAVFVFEDLHWADPAMLEFLEHLADWSEGVAMLVVCTARPELTELYEGWTKGLRNASTIGLPPLSEEDTARLIADLLDQSAVPAEIQTPIVERAGGNPLYAEEFVRMLKDRGLLVQTGLSWTLVGGAEIPFPENVQGLIAARLDTLSADRKAVLQDAAVLGKDFWSGALCTLGDRTARDVDEVLHELNRKEFIRSARSLSMEGEHEYAFWHMLVRDVAYAQIPRSTRAGKPVAAAEWVEARAGDRVEDLADVLAYHYAEALDLTNAIGGDTTALADRTLRFLVFSAQRTANLDPNRSEQMYGRALELAPADHPERPVILFQRAEVLLAISRLDEADDLLQEAIALFFEQGQQLRAVEAQVSLAESRARAGVIAGPRDLLDETIEMLQGLPPGKGLVRAYAAKAGWDYVEGVAGDGLGWADKS
jgi:predicted ATPase